MKAHSSGGPLFDLSETMLASGRSLWLQPFEDLFDEGTIREPRFMRGFVEDIVMDARTFVDGRATCTHVCQYFT